MSDSYSNLDDPISILYGTTVSLDFPGLLRLLRRLSREAADDNVALGKSAIFQLLQAHCTQLKHHALIQVLSDRFERADGAAIRLGELGTIGRSAKAVAFITEEFRDCRRRKR
jgi:hypothetical protein